MQCYVLQQVLAHRAVLILMGRAAGQELWSWCRGPVSVLQGSGAEPSFTAKEG